MTEDEWLTCTDARPMLHFIAGTMTDRKSRLFAIACCRRILHLCAARGRAAVDRAEQMAMGLLSPAEWSRSVDLERIGRDAAEACANQTLLSLGNVPREAALECAEGSARVAGLAHAYALGTDQAWTVGRYAVMREELSAQSDLLREIVGTPFFPVTIDLSWLSWQQETVRKIVESIDGDGTYQELPILADALEDAGCDDAEILAHCRSSGPHVRGCWVVDLLLDKQ